MSVLPWFVCIGGTSMRGSLRLITFLKHTIAMIGLFSKPVPALSVLKAIHVNFMPLECLNR